MSLLEFSPEFCLRTKSLWYNWAVSSGNPHSFPAGLYPATLRNFARMAPLRFFDRCMMVSSAIPQALIDRAGFASILGISTRKLDLMRSSGQLPEGFTVGKRSIRWRAETVRDFVEGLATC